MALDATRQSDWRSSRAEASSSMTSSSRTTRYPSHLPSAATMGSDAGAVAADGTVAPAAPRPRGDEELETVVPLADREGRAGYQEVERRPGNVLGNRGSGMGARQSGEHWAARIPKEVEHRRRASEFEQARSRRSVESPPACNPSEKDLEVVAQGAQFKEAVGVDGSPREA